jgi:hypothetical protein
MADIQSLIKMLQSDNTNERRAACKELRMLPSLPPEALQALRVAAINKNPGVSEAAQRALAVHTQRTKLEEIIENAEGKLAANVVGTDKGGGFASGFFGWFIIGNIIFIILGLISNLSLSLIALILFLLTAVASAVLFVKKRNWIAIGVLSAVGINAFAWLLIAPPVLGEFELLIMPLPSGLLSIMSLY